ncbi:MAG: Esterase [Actinomycetia bacterium]|nr:Esterase [Actinomycetes bacterium]
MTTRRRGVALLLPFLVALLVAVPGTAGAAASPRLDARGGAPDWGAPALSAGDRYVGMATASGGGYWLATSRGGVFSPGGAPFYGSAATSRRTAPVVGIAARPAGDGYWLVGSDGGVYAFGEALNLGSMAGKPLRDPIVGMAATPSGAGYWLVASDGGIFSFGDARFAGSLGGRNLVAPIVAIATAPSGYWLIASDGGVFSFGGARFLGSTGGRLLTAPITSVATTGPGDGYWLAAADGKVFAFGTARDSGSGTGSPEDVVAVASPRAGGYYLLRSPSGQPAPAGSGTGRRVVYSNPLQRVWLVGDDNLVDRTYLVSGRKGEPAAGTYQVYSRSSVTSAGHDGITMRKMVRFAHGDKLPIGFHDIPRRGDGTPLQTDDDLGGYRSSGCVRQGSADATYLWDWAPIGTKVVVIY